jgi:hypothetical protein
MRSIVVVLSCFAFVCAAVPGCTSGHQATPTVSKTTLQDGIAELIREAGVEPESVTCPADLIGEVGRTTQCVVEASPPDALLAPVVTVTGFDGAKVNWKIAPALTQDQVERRVAGEAADSASCESGLEGKKDSSTRCELSVDGVTVRRTVNVADVQNLAMKLTVALPKDEVEKALLDQMARQFGERPDTATCSGELEGVVGRTVECTVTEGSYSETFVLTVKSSTGNQIVWEYAYKD